MENRNRLLKYLLVNVAVSAITALLVLMIWTRINIPSSAPLFDEENADAEETEATTPVPGDYAGQLEISVIIGAGDVDSERVSIEHVGDTDVSLAGWRLVDEDGNQYRFPALVLHPGGEVMLFSQEGDDSVNELYWGRDDPVWTEGEEAGLIDPDGETQATYLVP